MIFSKSGKKFSVVCLCMLLGLSNLTNPLLASSATHSGEATSSTTERQAPPKDKPPHGHRDCPCQRPFRRFTMAMDQLKKDKLISGDDIKKIYHALMKIPPDTLYKVEDRDLTAAEMLHKDKILTDEQYQKISEFLKQNPPKR